MKRISRIRTQQPRLWSRPPVRRKSKLQHKKRQLLQQRSKVIKNLRRKRTLPSVLQPKPLLRKQRPLLLLPLLLLPLLHQPQPQLLPLPQLLQLPPLPLLPLFLMPPKRLKKRLRRKKLKLRPKKQRPRNRPRLKRPRPPKKLKRKRSKPTPRKKKLARRPQMLMLRRLKTDQPLLMELKDPLPPVLMLRKSQTMPRNPSKLRKKNL